MNDAKENVLAAAKTYWQIRNSGDLSDRRSDAHNDLIDALDAAGIRYEDREHAATIGREMLDAPAMRQLTMPEYVRLSCQPEHTPPLSDNSGSGQHMVLVSVLNALGFNPRGKAEALELAEYLVAYGYPIDENSAPDVTNFP